MISPNIGASPSGSDEEQAWRWPVTTPISGSRRRSTVMSDRPQPLQRTSNTSGSGMARLLGGLRVPEVLADVADVTGRRDAECFGGDADWLPGHGSKVSLVHAETRTAEFL